MSKIAIVTDSNSGITQEEGRRLGVSVIPMPFFINEKMYLEGITLSQDEFYQWLKSDASISTSQPSPGETMGLWDNLLKEYDEIVQIPMSSGLSATCATAMGLAQEYEGRVHVVDNQRISVTQRQSVVDAIALRDAGKSGAEIKKILEEEKFNSSIYITLETLKYLKKGGRITPAAAAIGTVLNLKPVLQLQGEKLDAFAKVRGKKQARRTMLKAMKADFEDALHRLSRMEKCVFRLLTQVIRKRQKSGSRRCRKPFLVWKSIWIRCHLVWHAILDMVLLQSHVLRK